MTGAWLGAWVVARRGILRGLVICGAAQALSNLAYAFADLAGGGAGAILAACIVESLCAGLGTTAFLALLMRVCEKERAAVEYALLSALFALTRDLTGAVSGEGVGLFGYAGWFAITALLALPGLGLVALPGIAERARERPLLGS
jgi:PAT family beta-lactamase induction signal transducer AmpG